MSIHQVANRLRRSRRALPVAVVVVIAFVLIVAAVTGLACGVVPRGISAVARETVEAAAKVSGRSVAPAAREAAAAELSRGVAVCGDRALLAARNGGLELTEAAARHGPEVWRLSSQVPEGARALALRPDVLLPLARRIGPDVLVVEARTPTLAPAVVEAFGDDAVHVFAHTVPPQDAPRLLGFGRCSADPGTRRLLLDSYRRDPDILNRLDWKVVAATGLSAAMVTGAYRVSGGVQDGLRAVAAEHPHTFRETVSGLLSPVTVPLLVLGLGAAVIALVRLWLRFRPPRSRK